MIRIISALILAVVASLCSAADPALPLADNAPDRHIVVPGDTLWGISGKFLKEPWRWPEIWRLNKAQIKNPQRIYPGDVIVLDRDADGRPRLNLAKRVDKLRPQIYAEPLQEEIPPIPPNLIEPFISQPLVIEADGLASAARIVATPQDRVILGSGDTAFVANAPPDPQRWQVYRPGKALLDPETKETLGYEAYYLGTARQTQPGDPAVFEIVTAKEEITRGDRLLPAPPPTLSSYLPHRPEQAVDARIVSVYGGVSQAGPLSVVALNRGARDGLEPGHVLALLRKRVETGRDEADRKQSIPLPPERYGLVFVFRTFERIAYALVVNASGSVVIDDYVRTP